MARVWGRDGAFCIHRHEAAFSGRPGRADQGPAFPDGSTRGELRARAGELPSEYLSWYQAHAACAQAGLHLCTSAEWEDACAGAAGRHYPTPDGALGKGRCGVGLVAGGQAGAALRPAGSFPDCHTPDGVYDLLGNAWEWTDPGRRDAAGRPLVDKRGAALYSGTPAPCAFSAVGTHPPDFSGSIGFRCCAP